MKKLLLLPILFSLFVVNAQDFSIKLFVEDNVGRKDTVVLGMNSGATLGIDTLLGERDIYGLPYDSLDIRIIQRDSVNHNCIRTSHYGSGNPPLCFPNNIDTKADYRHTSFTSFTSLNLNFEILITALEYPVTIRADYTDLQWHPFDSWSFASLINPTNCESLINSHIDALNNSGYDSIFSLPNPTFNTIILHFEPHATGLNEATTHAIKILPNPTSNSLSISLEEATTGNLSIRNSLGQIVLQEAFSNSTLVNIDLYGPTGIYFLQLETEGQIITKKIIKQ